MSDSYVAFSIPGRRYALRHARRMGVPGHYSEALYAYDDVTVPLRSCDHATCWDTAVGILGTTFDASYRLGAGTLHVGTYQEVDEEIGPEAPRHVALWTDDEYALWSEVEIRSGAWLAELFGDLAPERANTSVVAAGAEQGRFTMTHEDVLVTVDEVGAIGLYPERRWRPTSTAKGLRTRAGELFRGESNDRYIDTRSGEQRVVDKVYLRTPSAVAKLDLIETGPDEAVDFMAGFEEVAAS